MTAQYVPCRVRELPRESLIHAAKRAIILNPNNAVARGPARASMPPLPVEHLAALTGKAWPAAGVRLTVSFLDGPDQATRAKILSHANAWSRTANVLFTEVPSGGQVRVTRTAGQGYWSYLGTDILSIPANEPTMNLESFDARSTPDSEFYRVVRHEFGHCFAGDTLIDCPRDLEKYPLGIPIKDLVDKEPWVYGWKDGRPVVRKAARVWLSRQGAEVVRVRLKTGQGGRQARAFLPPLELVGTPEHRVLLADGKTWKALGDLQPGDRLCSLYRQKNGRRSVIRWTGSGRARVREHTFVCDEVYGPRPQGHDCHHVNGRMLDQSPENLEWKEEAAHHRDHSRGRVDSAETTARKREAQKGKVYTEETRAKMSRSGRLRPPASAETRAKISAGSKGKPQSPELVAKRTAAMNRFYAAGGRSGMYGKKASAETRAKQSASRKAFEARKAAAVNHVVVSVEPAGRQDVYDMTVPGAESFVANGVVVHNCLSWPHEHTRKEIVGRIDPQKADAYFLKYDGWDAQTVQQQVLTITPDSEITALPTDVRSIMAYGLPAEIMKDHIAVPGGTDIDDEDYLLCSKMYPKDSGGGGGGGGGGSGPAKKLFTLTFSRAVKKGGLVDFRAKTPIPVGSYDLMPAPGSDVVVEANSPDDEGPPTAAEG